MKAESGDLHVLRWQDAEYPLGFICATAAHGSSDAQPAAKYLPGSYKIGLFVPESSFSGRCCVPTWGR
jgi:hypothetical protein